MKTSLVLMFALVGMMLLPNSGGASLATADGDGGILSYKAQATLALAIVRAECDSHNIEMKILDIFIALGAGGYTFAEVGTDPEELYRLRRRGYLSEAILHFRNAEFLFKMKLDIDEEVGLATQYARKAGVDPQELAEELFGK